MTAPAGYPALAGSRGYSEHTQWLVDQEVAAYRRPEFVVPDAVTTYSPARTDVPAVVDVSAVARAVS
jgi:hypothetical protein